MKVFTTGSLEELGEAIEEAQESKKILLILLERKGDPLNTNVLLKCEKDYNSLIFGVIIKLQEGTKHFKDFITIYKGVRAPSLVFLGDCGMPLRFAGITNPSDDNEIYNSVFSFVKYLQETGFNSETTLDWVDKNLRWTNGVSASVSVFQTALKFLGERYAISRRSCSLEIVPPEQQPINNLKDCPRDTQENSFHSPGEDESLPAVQTKDFGPVTFDRPKQNIVSNGSPSSAVTQTCNGNMSSKMPSVVQDESKASSRINIVNSDIQNSTGRRKNATQPEDTKLQFRLADGTFHIETFNYNSKLKDVRNFVISVLKIKDFDLAVSYRQVAAKRCLEILKKDDDNVTLEELDLVPSVVLHVMQKTSPQLSIIRSGYKFLSLVLCYVFMPVTYTLRYILSFFSGGHSGPNSRSSGSSSSSNPPRPPFGGSGNPPPRNSSFRTVGRYRGNIHVLRSGESDEGNNTYNGNSTQQMP